MARLSGLQRDVLSLYRQCLRALKEKPDVCLHASPLQHSTNPRRLQDHISATSQGEEMCAGHEVILLIPTRNEFRKHLDVGKKDFGTIEYLLRRGRNQLETYSDPGIRDIQG